MRIELLNRRKWKTRVELANAIFDNDATPPWATGHRSSRYSTNKQKPRCQLANPTGTQLVGQVKA